MLWAIDFGAILTLFGKNGAISANVLIGVVLYLYIAYGDWHWIGVIFSSIIVADLAYSYIVKIGAGVDVCSCVWLGMLRLEHSAWPFDDHFSNFLLSFRVAVGCEVVEG